jgi:Major intrinsic protein
LWTERLPLTLCFAAVACALQGITFNLLRAALAEAIATAFFLFLTISTIQYTVALGAPGVLDSSKHFLISMTFGLSIFVLVYMFFSVSGGHINPAVTFCLMLGKRVSGVRALLYIAAQVTLHSSSSIDCSHDGMCTVLLMPARSMPRMLLLLLLLLALALQ